MGRKKEQSLAADVGARLRRIRERNGWSQKELADRLGVTPSQLSRWENGKILPDTDSQIDICDSVFVSMDEIIRGLGAIRGELDVDVELRELLRAIEHLDLYYRNQAREMLRAILTQARQDAGARVTERAAAAASPKAARR
jgi:transcriptional regulator with XRE-family HTH domain